MPRTAAVDVERIERARKTGQLALHFYHPILESDKSVYLRLYSVSQPVPLSEAIPILENMGADSDGRAALSPAPRER